MQNYHTLFIRMHFCILLGLLFSITSIASVIDDPQDVKPSGLRLGTFDVDATPPVGSRLAYNTMINSWDLGLRAKGIVLVGAGQPIVLCSLDWIGIANEGQDAFKRALADAAGTIPERVAVHTIHQHDAPICDFTVEKLLKDDGFDPIAFEGSFAREVIHRLEIAVRQSIDNSQPVTHIGLGEAPVRMVASNRRILGPDGRVRAGRMSSCRDSALIAEPEGLIDPLVSLVSFWNGDKPIAVLSYYAVHPQSYYGTGVANPDYPGVARFFRQLAVPGALHIHFNGAGCNIAAGKYNDGSREKRLVLAERLADGMKRAWEATNREPITSEAAGWTFEPVALPPAKKIEQIETRLMASLKAPKRTPGEENLITNDMPKIPWQQRCKAGKMINIGCLTLGRSRILFMPGELAIEYQLAAKAERTDLFVAMAAYGDYAPGYICTAIQYKQGGYEVGASGVEPEVEGVLMAAITKLLHDKK
jgi:hypothetical protein